MFGLNTMNKMHPLDKLISDDSLWLLEAIVAFVDYPYKRMLVMLIKYKELMSILNSLNDKNYISNCGFDCHPKSTEDMINDMCKFMPGDFSSSIQNMSKMMNMMNAMNAASNDSSGNNSNNPFSVNFNNMNDINKMSEMIKMFNMSAATKNNSSSTSDYEKASQLYDEFMNNSHDNDTYSNNIPPDYDGDIRDKSNNSSGESDSLYESVLNILDNEQ